jgi:flagellar protein FliT
MLAAARLGHWDEVVKLEGACVLLISQLKNAAREPDLDGLPLPQPQPAASAAYHTEAAKAKSRIMQRILVNDAEIRQLAEPWLAELDDTLAARPRMLH